MAITVQQQREVPYVLYSCINTVLIRVCLSAPDVHACRFFYVVNNYIQVNQKLFYREIDWWDVGLVVQKARKQGIVCSSEVW